MARATIHCSAPGHEFRGDLNCPAPAAMLKFRHPTGGDYMTEYKHLTECFLCLRQFQFGPSIYDGERVHAWDIMVCSICLSGNHDGIVPSTYPRLITHLEARGIQPKTNARGWICWPT